MALPPADEVTVTCEGADMLGNVALKVPPPAGVMVAVQGLPVAWLISFSVQVRVTPGVVSVAATVRVALLMRYVALVIVTVSVAGLTTTLTVAAVDVRFGATVLVAVTEKAKDVAAVPAGTVGAVNVCCAPFVPATGVSVIPAGAVHV